MTGEQIATLIVAVLGFAGVVYGVISNRKNKRLADRHDDASPERPSVQQVWDRQDKIEKEYGDKITAMSNILWALAEQLPTDFTPVFDEKDVIELAGEMPPRWRRLRHTGRVTPQT